MSEHLSLFKSYERRKFFMVFGVKIFLMICIPVFIFATSFLYYNFLTAKDKMETELQKNNYNFHSEINNMLSSFDLIHTSLSTEDSIHNYLLNSIDINKIHQFMTDFNADVQKFRASNNLISSIYLYRCSDEYIIAAGDNCPGNNYREYFTDKCTFSNNTDDIDYISVRNTTIGRQNLQFLSCLYPIYANDVMLGIICINVNTSEFKTKLDKILPKNASIDIFYNSNLILSTSTSECKLQENKINPLTGYVYSKNKVDLSGIDVSLCYKSDFMLNKYLYNIFSLLLIVLFLAVISWGISYISTTFFYNLLASIIIKSTDPLDMYEKDNQYTEQHNNFIKTITSHIHKSKSIEQEIYERLSAFSNLQFNYLQLQISPHFLYNTLNAISMLEIKLYKGSQIGKAINLLSDVLRYSLNLSEHMTDFDDELNCAIKYLDIQKLRYGESLNVIYQINSDTGKFKILKFILQPIIENAIYHGLANNEKCLLEINSRLLNDILTIEIVNTGDNINEDKINELNHMLEKGLLKPSRTSGLLNVNKRLKLVYGENYGCTIKTLSGKTIVTITIPNN